MGEKKSLLGTIKSWSYNKKFVTLLCATLVVIAIVVVFLALTKDSIGFENWYGLIMGIALVICVEFGQFSATKQGIYKDLVFDYAIVAVPYAFIGGIVYYAMFHNGDMGLGVLGALTLAGASLLIAKFMYQNMITSLFPKISPLGARIVNSLIFSIPFVLLGGIAETSFKGLTTLQFGIFGILIGLIIGFGLGFMLFESNYKHPKVTMLQMLDLCGVYFLMGQAIGRIGCYFGNCCYGIEVDFDIFPFSYMVNGSLHLGNPFIESMWCALGCIIFASIYLSKRKCFQGFFISCYCIWYGIERFILEFFRASEQKLTVIGDFGSSQLVSLVMIAFGIIFILQYIIRAKLNKKKILLFSPIEKLGDDYFLYEKTIYAHPHVTPNGEKIEANYEQKTIEVSENNV